ncbi:MAG: PEP-CTERM sorting domain-containing protein [Pirellulales bacterium]|nr:PEP-CTERM sorting domain-containing protein [Pirellulales bacterium]
MNGQRMIGLGIVMAILATCSMANAGLIPLAISGVTGTAYHPGDSLSGDGSVSRALDGSGLTVGDPGDSSTWTHDAAWQNNWQGQGSFLNGNTPGCWFIADLGSIHTDLANLYIWNVREVLDRGMKDVDIFYSSSAGNIFDPSWVWTSLGSYTIAQATGGGTPADTVIDLSSISAARYIGFDIKTNYGSAGRVGVAEMQFTVIPEPSSILLTGLALTAVGLLFSRWRRF